MQRHRGEASYISVEELITRGRGDASGPSEAIVGV